MKFVSLSAERWNIWLTKTISILSAIQWTLNALLQHKKHDYENAWKATGENQTAGTKSTNDLEF